MFVRELGSILRSEKDKKMRSLYGSRTILAALMGLAVWFGSGGVAIADDYTCTTNVGAMTVDNVQVPAGAVCTLTGTRVEGNVFVQNNARLSASGVRVDGNVHA